MIDSHRQVKQAREVIIVAFVCVCLVLTGSGLGVALAQAGKTQTAADLGAAFTVDWIQTYYDQVQAASVDAPSASRVYAYFGVTLYESVVPAMPGYASLGGRLKGLAVVPPPDTNAVYDWPTVASAALADVLPELVKGDKAAKAAADLRARESAARSSVGSDVISRSLDQGDKVARAILDRAAHDGYAEAITKEIKIPTGENFYWIPTSPGSKPVGTYWGSLQPWALENSDICEVKRNIEFSTEKNSTFYAQANEVKTVQENLTKEQKAIADYWADTPGITGAPAGHWMMIAGQLVTAMKLKLDRAAVTYAMLGMALADSFIACWELKYKDSLLRPETYIKRYITPSWGPYVQTPPFPTYPSGHSIASEAAAEVLTALFGTVAFSDTTHVARLKVPARTFTSFEAAANEAAISRLYGGIHFRFDIENGLRQGRCVGDKVLANIMLKAS